jgi:hypothetical protein
MIPHGKQAGMRSVNLRGMVEIDPYKDDLFRKIIEQRKLRKADEALYYWLKILANSIYGFFVELNPDTLSNNAPVRVFSGEASFPDSSDVIENPGPWFFPPLASLITSGGRLLLAMTEACVRDSQGGRRADPCPSRERNSGNLYLSVCACLFSCSSGFLLFPEFGQSRFNVVRQRATFFFGMLDKLPFEIR